jgi:NitT/TauT family transport system substrate-binding protein
MRKKSLLLAMLFLFCTARVGLSLEPFCISGPPVAESLIFAVMARMELAGESVEFIPWNSPDQARAMIATGKIQGAVITTTNAATFFNKGVKTGIAAVFDSPLWVVSTNTAREVPLKGIIFFPFGHGEMPGILFSTVMGEELPGLEARHTGGALESVNLMLLGRGDHALLAEPAASLAVARSRDREGPMLFKHLHLGREWEKKFTGHSLFASALCVFGRGLDHPERSKEVIKGYHLAREWMMQHPGKTIELAKKELPALAVQICDGRLTQVGGELVSGDAAFASTRFFLEKIYEKNPGAVGGKLPGPELFMDLR